MRAFADALDSVPMALAENSGLSPIETLANIKSRQAKENNPRLGVDCMQTGSNGESAHFVSFCPFLVSALVTAVVSYRLFPTTLRCQRYLLICSSFALFPTPPLRLPAPRQHPCST